MSEDPIEVTCPNEDCQDHGVGQEYTEDQPIKYCALCGSLLEKMDEEHGWRDK